MNSLPSSEATGRSARPEAIFCEIDGLPVVIDEDEFTMAGLFVRTPDPRAVDEELEIFLRSELGEIHVTALVVQVIGLERAAAECRVPGFGVLFTDLREAHRDWLGMTCAVLAKRQAEAQAAQRAARAREAKAESRKLRKAAEPPPEKKGPSAECRANLRLMRRKLGELEMKAPADILGVPTDCSVDAAHAAFLAASKRYHPHLFARFDSAELDEVMTELFIAHKRAYGSLRKSAESTTPSPSVRPGKRTSGRPDKRTSERPGKRSSARSAPRTSMRPAAIKAGAPPDGVEQPTRPLRAVDYLQRPATPEAPKQAVAPAVSVSTHGQSVPPPAQSNPVARAQIAVGDALKHLAASRYDEAEEGLTRAAKLDPESREAKVWLHVCKARCASERGKQERALAAYERVLSIDPKHREALNALGRTGEGKAGGKGVLGKLFGSGNE